MPPQRGRPPVIQIGSAPSATVSTPRPSSCGSTSQSLSPTSSPALPRSGSPSRIAAWQRGLHKLREVALAILAHRWFSWIRPKLKWPFLKPVLRCAIAAWAGLLVQLIHPSERVLGYAALLANLFFFNALAWAWLALGVFIADQVRSPVDPSRLAAAEAKWGYLQNDPVAYNMRLIFDATYVEANSAVVCAVFLSVGTGSFLWYKLRTQPSPATFPLVLSCILMDIGFTTAALYPYPRYTTGLLFFLPMAVQAGIAAICSIAVFPESVGHSFQGKLNNVLRPLGIALDSIEGLFEETVAADTTLTISGDNDRLAEWADKSKHIRNQLLQSLGGVPPLRAQQRYLKVDFSYGRLSSSDLRDLFDRIATVQTRSGGMAFFFDVIVTNAKHLHLDSSAFSVHHPSQSRPSSRPASIRESIDGQREEDQPESDGEESISRRFHFPVFKHRRSGSPHGMSSQKASHVSLLDYLRKSQQPVGIYESQRYMDVERAFNHDTEHILEQLSLLANAALPLVRQCRSGLSAAIAWLEHCNRGRHHGTAAKDADSMQNICSSLQHALAEFDTARLVAIKPYRHVFDPAHPPADDSDHRRLKHRGLFQVFVAHYHLMEFSEALLRLLHMLADFDTARPHRKFWYPRVWALVTHMRSSHTEMHLTDGDDEQEDDGDFARHDEDDDELGEANKRNPEYVPFENPILNILSRLASLPNVLRSRGFSFAVKAGVLTALTTLPQFIASSAAFYYYNRGIWCAIMAQLTLAMYSGDTTAAWLGRCVASFWGAVFGMAVWYIGSGDGRGNPYGLAAACAVAFPIAMFFRIHFPGAVLTAVMTPVTFGIIIGYSYLNATVVQLTSATWGFDVAWRRFVCVLIGITAAFIFSYLPPVYSAKRAIRHSYAATISASGTILCDIITHANHHHYHLAEDIYSRQKLLSWRSKLNKLGARHANAKYEYSLRGRWPEERYKALQETLQDLLSLLAQLNHVLAQLERPWRKALLERTRLCDPIFLGDVLAVVAMCSTSLRSGHPLPQITPSPLVARFRMGKTKGLEIPQDPSDHSGDIPSLVTVDVLESDHYMRYALGATTTFSILSRLDRIVVICKTLLGENYHVGGLHLESQQV